MDIEESFIEYLESNVETDDIDEEIEIESAEEDTSDSVCPRESEDELDSQHNEEIKRTRKKPKRLGYNVLGNPTTNMVSAFQSISTPRIHCPRRWNIWDMLTGKRRNSSVIHL